MNANVSAMAKTATTSLMRQLPDNAYLKKIGAAKLQDEMEKVLKKLVKSCSVDIRHGQITSATKLRNFVKAAIGGVEDNEIFNIIYTIVRATYEYYIVSYMGRHLLEDVKSRRKEDAYEDYFRQQMYLIENPLVDILAHPWDAIEMAAGGWYLDRDREHIKYDAILDIPREYNDKLMNALIEHNKCAEINLATLLTVSIPEKCRKYYWTLLAQWREAGVKFVIGSDQHSAHCNPVMFAAAELLLDAYGFKDSDIKYFFNPE